MTATMMPPVEGKRDHLKAPTILAALSESTREERKADPVKGDDLAVRLYGIMKQWSEHWEGSYLEADENWEFFLGRHYGYFSTALNARVALPEAPPGIKRLTYNYIRRWVERCVSIVLKDPPIIKCLAGDSEVVDRAASEAADDIVDWRQCRTALRGDPERVTRDACVSGWSWVHEEWDSSTGPTVPYTNDDGTPRMSIVTGEDGMPVMDAMGQPTMEQQEGPQGDFSREILAHRQGVPDPTATHPFGGSGFFVRKRISRFDLAKWRPELNIEEDYPAQGGDRMKKVADLGRGMTSSGTTESADANRDDLELVLLYVPKCPDLPRGARFIFTEKHLIEEEDNPRYPTEEEKFESEPNQNEEPAWPVFPFLHMIRAQSPLGYSPVHDAIQMNKAINGLGSSAVTHAAAAKGKWKVPADLAAELTNETLQVVKVPRRGFDHNTFGAVAPPPMSPEYLTLWREHRDAGLEFMGLNQPAVGGQESAGDSGYKVKLQQQVADNDLEKVRGRHNNMWAAIHKYDLMLWRRHADTKRTIEIIGENRRSALKEFDRTAILPGTSVRCVNDSSIPRDPAARMIWLQQFMQTGVMQLPPMQRQEMFQLMRLQDFKSFEEMKQGDLMRAERQIRRIMDGQDPGQVSDMDDHAVQMERLRQFGLSEEFETKVEQELKSGPPTPPGMAPIAPPTSPTFDRLVGLYQAHKNALMAQQAAMAPPPMPGADTPPGGAPAAPTAPPPAVAA